MSRMKEMRASRRASQFQKFRITQLNLVPLVDTFVSIVFFALTTSTVGELAPVVPGVRLPEATVGEVAMQQLTLGIGKDVSLAGQRIMSAADAAMAQSNDPRQPMLIPPLYSALRVRADSMRRAAGIAADQPVRAKLAIQGDKSMRYDLLSRMMQTARIAGFRDISLQVNQVSRSGVTPSTAPAGGAQ